VALDLGPDPVPCREVMRWLFVCSSSSVRRRFRLSRREREREREREKSVADFSLCVCGNKLHTSVFERGFERFGGARISNFGSLLVCILVHFSLLLIPFGVLLLADVCVCV
jgi:hypothetical protein